LEVAVTVTCGLGPIAQQTLGVSLEAQRDDTKATVRQRAGDAIDLITVPLTFDSSSEQLAAGAVSP
jgi:hypothetical protein